MKQLLGYCIIVIMSCTICVATDLSLPWNDYAQEPYDGWMKGNGPDSIDLGKTFKETANKDGIFEKLLKFLGIDVGALADGGIGFVKSLINIILSLAGLIALLFMIYGFVRIFFVAGEEGVKTAWTIVRISAIALAIIALAWFIESAMFYLYEKVGHV